MGKTRSFLFIVLCAIIPCKEAQAFHEIAFNGAISVSEGHIDRYDASKDPATRYSVWLYTRASCDAIGWTLGGQKHSENLVCGTTVAFINVPAGIHHVVVEGCGKRIAAYLSVSRDMHLMVAPSDLGNCDRCPGDGGTGESNSFYVDFPQSLNPSFISGL